MGGILSCCVCSTASCCMGQVCSCFGRAIPCGSHVVTRVVYTMIFVLYSVLSWVLSRYSEQLFSKWNVFEMCPQQVCFSTLTLYRLGFALTIWFAAQGVLMIAVRSTRDCRSSIQNGWWLIKLLLLVGTAVGSFWIPVSFFTAWGIASICGAALFIIIQLFLLVDFAHTWNEAWVEKWNEDDDNKIWWWGLLCSMVLLYMLALGLIIAEFILFAGSSCGLNTFFISFSLIASFAYTLLSIHPKIREAKPASGLLQSAVVSFYSAYLVWSGIGSEPSVECNSLSGGGDTVSLLLGAALVFVSVTYSALRTSSSNPFSSSSVHEPLLDSETQEEEEDAEPAYNYCWFHISFMLASMYMLMLMSNWQQLSVDGSDGGASAGQVYVDRGWASMWVKISSGWVAALIYVWTLIAPLVFPDRDFN